MKNIIILTSSLTGGGAERAAGQLSMQLSSQYHITFFLLSKSKITYPYSGNVTYIDFEKMYKEKEKKWGKLGKVIAKFSYLEIIFAIKREKRKISPYATISFLDTPNLFNIFSSIGEKIIVSVRNNRSTQNNTVIQRMENFGIRHFYKKSNCIVPVSYGVAEDLMEYFGISESKMNTINNFYDFSMIRNKSFEPLPSSAKKAYSKKVILGMGRLTKQKNFEGLIAAVAKVFQSHDDYNLVILGSGELKSKLEAMIEDYNIRDRVFLVEYSDNPFPYIRNADLFVMNSLYEGFCNSIIEAMVCNTMVIASDCKSGSREIIADKKEYKSQIKQYTVYDKGIMVPVSDNEQLTSAILYAVSHPEVCDRCVAKADEYILSYSNESVKKQWISVIEG